MQTFLPVADFVESARLLDDKRLGKQRVEAWQLLRAVLGEPSRWLTSPAAQMWVHNAPALAEYGRVICEEWRRRGHQDSLLPRFEAVLRAELADGRPIDMPFWLGDERVHASHRANLLRKDPAFYGRYGWGDDPSMPYFWPIPKGHPLWRRFIVRRDRTLNTS